MSISRSLNLAISLTGNAPFKRVLQQLQTEAVKLRQSLSNIPVNIKLNSENVLNKNSFNELDTSLGAQYLTPLESVTKDIKSKKLQLNNEIQGLSNVNLRNSTPFANDVLGIRFIKPLDNTINNIKLKNAQLKNEVHSLGNVGLNRDSSLNDTLGIRFIKPLDNTINTIKLKGSQLKNEINGISNTDVSPKLNTKNTSSSLNLSFIADLKKQISSLPSIINLKIKLTGDKEVKIQLSTLETEIDNLTNKLKNITIGKIKNGNNVSNIEKQFVQPLDNTIKSVKLKGSQLKKEIQSLSTNSINTTPISNPVVNIQPNVVRVNRAYKAAQNNPDVSTFTKDISNYASNINNVKLTSADVNAIKNAEIEAKITAERVKQLKLGEEMAAKMKKTQQDELDRIENTYKTQKQRMQEIEQKARSLVQTGFGLHIVQIYIAPILYGLEQITTKMITTFSEFDKLYTNYKVKSEEYGEWLSKGDFYSSSIGQTFGIQDASIAAERFAASGVDVAKSQQALTSVMQVATVADMDYAEAANGVIKTMQAMHMQVGQTTEITDALINSANASTAELADLVQWFEYSASSAYQMGVDVQNLSAYLGILASSGTPNTGAAMRQLFLQLSKEDIQSNLKGKFSWITDEDLTDFNTLIGDMREYVRSQNDQSAATLEITRLLGGKANAQQALNNLLMAEPELWNQITGAVKDTGSTQDLYNKITDNAADAIKRIRVNIEILFTQFGESIGFVISGVATILTWFTKALIALPSPLKTLIGVGILVVTAFTAISFVIIGVIGALAIMAGTASSLAAHETILIGVTQGWSAVLKKLITEIYTVAFAGNSMGAMLKGVTASTAAASTATQMLSERQLVFSSVLSGISGAFIGYMGTSALMQKQMYSEAYVVGHLTAMWIAYNAAKAASVFGPVAAIGAGLVAGSAYEALVYSQIETMKNNAFNSSVAKQTGMSNSTVNKNTTVNIANANISNDGMDIEDLVSAMDVDYDE